VRFEPPDDECRKFVANLIVGEVKGPYSVPIGIGTQAADRPLAEAGRQMKLATKYGLRAENVAGFQNAVGSKYRGITSVPY
jgi:hypothetical protein